jgi:IS30 family transposase
MRISHEAIYQALYVPGREALRRELTACLRTGRALRIPQARTRGRGKRFVTPEVMITQRPAEAEDQAIPEHWEGDRATWKSHVVSGIHRLEVRLRKV